MSAPTQTVFIVDDDPGIRSSLARALEMHGFEVETYGSGPEFLDAYDPARAGCLILDYGMPDMDGLELQHRLFTLGYHIPIIFVTGHGGVPESVQAMKGGAIDFIEKPFRQQVLLDQIANALAADARHRLHLDKSAAVQRRFDSLTDREQEILRHMVLNPSATSSKEVGRALDISPRTVDHHRARILEKMEARSVVDLVEAALNAKIISDPTP